jgi:serine phosphatase RsbU (regulator of sigma subunit)
MIEEADALKGDREDNRERIGGQIQDIQIAAEKAVEEENWESAVHFYAKGFELRAVELALINSVQEGLSTQSDMQAIYDLVGDKLRDTFNAQVVMISQYDPKTDRIYHHYAYERGEHLQIPGWNPIDSSRSTVIKTKKPFMICGEEIIRVLEAQMMHVVPGTEVPKTWLGVPMIVGSEAIGIVSLQNLDKENAFSRSDIELLSTLTTSMSQSLENARLFNETQRLLNLLEKEMTFARQAQQSILPIENPRYPGYDIGSLIKPALAVGGDFYDFIKLDNDRIGFIIGDVSDKGLPAALFMAVTLSLLRAEYGRTMDQDKLLNNVNRLLLRMNAKMFVTILLGALNINTGKLKYSRAGHLPPIILDHQGKTIHFETQDGIPLGLTEDLRIDQQEVALPKGGTALFFSDGVLEALDASGSIFGFDRISEELRNHQTKTSQMICENLWEAVKTHSGELEHQDDFTVVVVKRE